MEPWPPPKRRGWLPQRIRPGSGGTRAVRSQSLLSAHLGQPRLGALCPLSGSRAHPTDDREGREAVDPAIPEHMAASPPKPDLGEPNLKVRDGSKAAFLEVPVKATSASCNKLSVPLRPDLQNGDRAQPSVEAAPADADHSAQRGHGMVAPLGWCEASMRQGCWYAACPLVTGAPPQGVHGEPCRPRGGFREAGRRMMGGGQTPPCSCGWLLAG